MSNNNKEHDFPYIPKALLDKLDELFPDKVPEMSMSDREVWSKVGARGVVRFLQMKYEEQLGS